MAISAELQDVYLNNPHGIYFMEAIDIDHAILDTTLRYTNASKAFEGLIDNSGTAAALYTPLPFTIVLPDKDTDGTQSLDISLSNVTTTLVAYITSITSAPQSAIELTYRIFLSTQKDGNDAHINQLDPPWRYEVSSASLTQDAVVMSATKLNTHNRSFPRVRYTRTDFPGLAR
jgi:hypothetical protein